MHALSTFCYWVPERIFVYVFSFSDFLGMPCMIFFPITSLAQKVFNLSIYRKNPLEMTAMLNVQV